MGYTAISLTYFFTVSRSSQQSASRQIRFTIDDTPHMKSLNVSSILYFIPISKKAIDFLYCLFFILTPIGFEFSTPF